jgi:hypothetical protein
MNPDEHEIFAHTFIDPNKLISGHKDIDSIYVDSETNDGLMDVFQQINNNETVLHALKYLRNKVVHVELSRSKKQNIQFALKNDIRSPIASNIHIECIDCTDGNGDMFNYVNPKTLAEAQEKGCMIEEENIVMLDMSDFHEDPSSQRFQDIKNAIEGKPIDEFLEEAIKSVKRIFKQMKDHFPSISSCS